MALPLFAKAILPEKLLAALRGRIAGISSGQQLRDRRPSVLPRDFPLYPSLTMVRRELIDGKVHVLGRKAAREDDARFPVRGGVMWRNGRRRLAAGPSSALATASRRHARLVEAIFPGKCGLELDEREVEPTRYQLAPHLERLALLSLCREAARSSSS